MRIGHTGDIHIDHAPHSPLPTLRAAAWRGNKAVVDQMVASMLEHEVEVAVVAGDNFSHGRPSPEAILMLVEALRPLPAAGVALVIIEGNHERLRHRAGQRTSTLVLAEALAAHGEVHVVAEGAELVRLANGAQVATLPWLDSYSVLRASDALGLTEPEQHDRVARHAVETLASLAEQANADGPLIATSHLTVASAKRGSERDLTALFREPVVGAAALAALPFSYVGLGHIHTPQELADGVWYAGSPQRFTFTDEPDTKGWNLVEVDESGLVGVTRIPLRARSFLTIDMEAGGSIEVPRRSLVRVRLATGEQVVPPEVEDAVAGAGARIVVVQRRRTAPDGQQVDESVDIVPTDPVEALRHWLRTNHPEADIEAVVAASAGLAL